MTDVLVRELISAAERDAAYVLRHRICVAELGWVPPRPDGRETDLWDRDALHLGAFDGALLVGYIRVVADSAKRGIMTRRCFGDLYTEPDPRPPTPITGDLSRLVVDVGHREPSQLDRISVALIDVAHRRSRAAGMRFWYLVSGAGRVELLRDHFADVRVLGCGPTTDGSRQCVALVDLGSRVHRAGQPHDGDLMPACAPPRRC